MNHAFDGFTDYNDNGDGDDSNNDDDNEGDDHDSINDEDYDNDYSHTYALKRKRIPKISQNSPIMLDTVRGFIQNRNLSDLIAYLVVGATQGVTNWSRVDSALGFVKTLLGINI